MYSTNKPVLPEVKIKKLNSSYVPALYDMVLVFATDFL